MTIDRKYIPQACDVRGIEQAQEQIVELLVQTGILREAMYGRLPWGLMVNRERKAWLANVEAAASNLDEARRMALIAARTAFEEVEN